MATQRKESPASRMLKAYGKERQRREQLKQAILLSAIRQKMGQQGRREDFEYRQNYKTPEQRFLENRYRAQNPLAQVTLPNERGEVELPGDEVVKTPSGKYQSKPISEDKQNRLYLQKLEQVKAAHAAGRGPAPSPLAIKIGERMVERLNKRLGYAPDKPEKYTKEKEKEYRPNDATKRVLKEMAGRVARKELISRQDALSELEEMKPAFSVEGVDTDYVQQQIQQSMLPDLYETTPAKKGFFGFGSKPEQKRVGPFRGDTPDTKKSGGVWYKKSTDDEGNMRWEPING